MVNQPRLNVQVEHFFEAKGLGAKLHLVVGPTAGRSFFIFDRPGLDDARGRRVAPDFDEIRFAAEAERIGIQWKRPQELPSRTVLVAGRIDRLMGKIAKQRVLIGSAQTVHKLQMSTTLTVEKIIERREGQRIGLIRYRRNWCT